MAACILRLPFMKLKLADNPPQWRYIISQLSENKATDLIKLSLKIS